MEGEAKSTCCQLLAVVPVSIVSYLGRLRKLRVRHTWSQAIEWISECKNSVEAQTKSAGVWFQPAAVNAAFVPIPFAQVSVDIGLCSHHNAHVPPPQLKVTVTQVASAIHNISNSKRHPIATNSKEFKYKLPKLFNKVQADPKPQM